jgi:hypothetical protein
VRQSGDLEVAEAQDVEFTQGSISALKSARMYIDVDISRFL